jgi:N-methylhydantoinase A
VDCGGTFTDICLFEEDGGRIEVWKTTSTPDNPSRGIAEGLAEANGGLALAAADICYFGHGTTVATNALIERQGTPTGLVTTDGFRDLLEIGRQKRPALYAGRAGRPQLRFGDFFPKLA